MEPGQHISLTLFSDPMMGLAYECEPTLDRLAAHYGRSLELRHAMVVLVRDAADFMTGEERALPPAEGLARYNARLAQIYLDEEAIGGLPMNMAASVCSMWIIARPSHCASPLRQHASQAPVARRRTCAPCDVRPLWRDARPRATMCCARWLSRQASTSKTLTEPLSTGLLQLPCYPTWRLPPGWGSAACQRFSYMRAMLSS
ncbi:MAG: hypothetical protein Q4B54_14650, partial [Coriobacteriales bacterium]|nr:hypothetical protein [Coriobacteriales bacterium]